MDNGPKGIAPAHPNIVQGPLSIDHTSGDRHRTPLCKMLPAAMLSAAPHKLHAPAVETTSKAPRPDEPHGARGVRHGLASPCRSQAVEQQTVPCKGSFPAEAIQDIGPRPAPRGSGPGYGVSSQRGSDAVPDKAPGPPKGGPKDLSTSQIPTVALLRETPQAMVGGSQSQPQRKLRTTTREVCSHRHEMPKTLSSALGIYQPRVGPSSLPILL